jgi:hypothetical protein
MQRKMKKKGLATLKWWLSDQKRPKATKISKMAVQSSLEATSNQDLLAQRPPARSATKKKGG